MLLAASSTRSPIRAIGAFAALAAICLFGLPPFSSVAAADSRKHVLILNSYNQGNKWTDDLTHGIVTGLQPENNSFKIFTEYMGTKWVNDKFYFRELARLSRSKYGSIPFDVLISTDNDAFDFLVDYRDEVFGKVPTVFCGVNFFSEPALKGKTLFTGINETVDIQENLDLMMRLHPSTKEIAVVNDLSLTGKIIHDEIVGAASSYRGRVRFRFLEDLSMDDLLAEIEGLAPDSLILYTFFFRDNTGSFYEYDEAMKRISQHANVPIYGAWDYNLGYGIVGGRLTSGFDHGQAAGKMALRILSGQPVTNIPVIQRSQTRYLFDYRQMKRFGIKTSDLPKGSGLINEPVSLYTVNQGLVWSTLAGLVGLSGVVIILLMNIRRRLSAERSLRTEIDQRIHAQQGLQQAHDELETRVLDRTCDLARVNQLLMLEITERKRAEKELRALSERDPLTQAFNRRKLFEILGVEIERSKRYHRPLSVIILDLDHFKKVNDTHGHGAGDVVLKMTINLISRLLRKADFCARYGGEEFVVLSPETTAEGAHALAEKIRSALEGLSIPAVGKVTISAGVTELIYSDTDNTLLKRADDALYLAKKNGRNRVEIMVPPTQA